MLKMNARLDIERLLLIGCGKMGRAMLDGWLATGVLDPAQVTVVEPSSTIRNTLADIGVRTDAELPRGTAPDIAVFAVKPNLVVDQAQLLSEALSGRLAISIAAGIALERLETAAPDAQWVRAMPNQPAVVGEAATGLCAGKNLSSDGRALASALFDALGIAVWIEDEPLMHAVTGLSGSGPAFVALVAEAMEDAGVRCGLPRSTARQLALQTLRGSASQMQQSGDTPAALKDAVTSPGGTTIAGIEAAESAGLRAALMQAIQAATHRSRELDQ